MAKGKTKQSASDKLQYANYKTRFSTNKMAKLEKLAKSQPNNLPLQAALEKAISKGIPYTRNRKSAGHKCKGLYKALGFDKNQASEGIKFTMKKQGLGLHWLIGCDIQYAKEVPNHGKSMAEQFEALGYERKYKKASR